MSRTIDIAKVLALAAETKVINLDVPLREIASSRLIDIVNAADEPWDLICADWISLIRKGPRVDSIVELSGLAESLRASLGIAGQAAAIKGVKQG